MQRPVPDSFRRDIEARLAAGQIFEVAELVLEQPTAHRGTVCRLRNPCRHAVVDADKQFQRPPHSGGDLSRAIHRWLNRSCRIHHHQDAVAFGHYFNARELAMNLDLEQRALNGCPPEEQGDWLRVHIRRERQWFEILAYLMRHEPHDLTSVVFDGVDRLQHLFWDVLDPNLALEGAFPREGSMRALCRDYFRQLDGLIEQAVTLAGTDANVFIVSDHGFGPSHEVVHVNSWLARQGFLTWASGDPVPRDDADAQGIGIIGRMDKLIDWSATLASAGTPSSNGIHHPRASP